MDYQRIDVAPLAGALAAEISGVDLAALDDETFAEIHHAWLAYQVVFFRDQYITPDQQLAFAHRLGDIHHHPFMQGMDSHPDIFEIIKEETDTHTFSATWHTDQMFNPNPAKATMLYAKETPDAGGDTLFASMYLAYDALSDGMKDMLADVETWSVGDKFKQNRGAGRAERYGGNEKMAAKVKDPDNVITEAAHPLFRTHPETGRKGLYIGSHMQTFVDFGDDEAEPIIAFLCDHATRLEFTCRFHWQPGSLALWDNRCVQHHAIADYNGQRRRMHRITIAGDTPY
jgi:taurine dioxygenase